MTDTGQSCISGPKFVMNYIGYMLFSLIEDPWGTDLEEGWFKCNERTKLPNFWLLYGGYWMEVRSEDYIIEMDWGYCALCFHPDRNDEWILGDAFMRGWYNIHDHDKNRFGFVPYRGSQKKPAQIATRAPTVELSFKETSDFDGFVTYQHGISRGGKNTLIVFAFLAAGGIAILVWQLTKKAAITGQKQVEAKTSLEAISQE